ncbi:ISPg3 transposase [Porphyromonas gingivalis]|nr:hypothetical protein HMPREF1989_02283 [Porphyromonas gingivalis F0566]SJM19041.1 ISPg3 transposase [Porphyromonas gingivalis]
MRRVNFFVSVHVTGSNENSFHKSENQTGTKLKEQGMSNKQNEARICIFRQMDEQINTFVMNKKDERIRQYRGNTSE